MVDYLHGLTDGSNGIHAKHTKRVGSSKAHSTIHWRLTCPLTWDTDHYHRRQSHLIGIHEFSRGIVCTESQWPPTAVTVPDINQCREPLVDLLGFLDIRSKSVMCSLSTITQLPSDIVPMPTRLGVLPVHRMHWTPVTTHNSQGPCHELMQATTCSSTWVFYIRSKSATCSLSTITQLSFRYDFHP